jgi:pseudouridine-5'-phosphate glycosidase
MATVAVVSALQMHPEVSAALTAGAPVVALESALVTHGLPHPDNVRIARAAEQAVRDHGAVPATVAVVAGQVRVGLDDAALEALATGADAAKASLRDVPVVVARGGSAGTTVAATARIAARTGIVVFATGGLGGVHRGARDTWDESADLATLASTPITVVCAGVKSILDVAATLERLETLNVAVVGYRTDEFPGFYVTTTGHPVAWRADYPDDVATIMRARDALGLDGAALVVANPLPLDRQLDPAWHGRVLDDALADAATAGVHGKDVTPFVLDRFHTATGGASLAANEQIILGNAALAAQIARAARPVP